MLQLAHTEALHFEHPVKSFWEDSAAPLQLELAPLAKSETCEVAVIGGGITGLSAALELAQTGVDVCLIEAGHLGWGASGRNGGFVCIGSHKRSYTSLIKSYGLEATQHYYRVMRESIDCVAELCAIHRIDAEIHGKGEASLAHLPSRLKELHEERECRKALFGEDTEFMPRAALRDHGMHGPLFHGALCGQHGFGIHPLNYVRGIARAAHHAGAKLYPHSKLLNWEQVHGTHILHTSGGALKASRVVVATNGYTPEKTLPLLEGRVLPALSSIIVTRPLTQKEMQEQGWSTSTMAYDTRDLLHYFRLLPDNRFLFGGRGGLDSSEGFAQTHRQTLISEFHTLFPAWANVEITHFWRGFVCLSYDRVPYLGALDNQRTVWTSLAYHGNGVAMASWCGTMLARLITGKANEREVPATMSRRLARFPLPSLRPLYLRGAYLWYNWKDQR